MYKAIFIDIDGTLKNDKKEITSRTKEIIKKITSKGIYVVITSGRPDNSASKISMEANASNYVITSNGAHIYNYKNDETLYSNSIQKEICKQLYELAGKEQMTFIMNIKGGRVVSQQTQGYTERILSEPIDSFLDKNEVFECVFVHKEFEKIKDLKSKVEKIKGIEIKNQSKALTNPLEKPLSTTYCDIANIEISKGLAIKEFCKIKNIDLKDTIAIGDDYNDVSMFEVAGISVAMGNANDEVKQYAKEITDTNNNEGVAKFLENFYKQI